MAEGGGEVGKGARFKKDGLAKEGFGWFSQKTRRMERERGLAPDPGTL